MLLIEVIQKFFSETYGRFISPITFLMLGIFCSIGLLRANLENSKRMDVGLMVEILDKLRRGENIIFTKYGDGEYLCMSEQPGANIDGDDRHPRLGKALRNALLSLSQKPNAYIGRWHPDNRFDPNVLLNFSRKPKTYIDGFDEIDDLCISDQLTYRHVGKGCDAFAQKYNITIPWVNYHLFMNDDDFNKHHYLHAFVEFVQSTHRKKIIVMNGINRRLLYFFKADIFIEIPAKNWSYQYEHWKTLILSHIEKDCILLVGGGTCSKVLIDDVTNMYHCTCIDLGSSFDMLASRKNTRGWRHTYADEVRYYVDLLPANWEMLS